VSEFWTGRGNPWEHDPGPPLNRSWLSLFAQTPNYRGLGRAVLGREQFRWHFGPMFYRGRLTDGDVKVLVIGQEGAQDESLAHRSFIGGTGSRMQHVLNHLGITRSYLFLNTFVYPIFGQYNTSLRGLAQDPDSPIVQHRHRLWNEVLDRNDLRLVIAVGTAAKDSVVTWITSRGGSCPGGLDDLTTFKPKTALGPRTRAIGVLHPGGAAGGSSTAIVADFKKKLAMIETWADDDPTWLPVDSGATRLPAAAYLYKSDPIPFRDLPFGTCWRVGSGSTSSNRKDDQRSIQLFSDGGHYNGRGDNISYASDAAGTQEGYDADAGDLPYEPPRAHPTTHDRGPNATLAQLLQGGAPGLEWPDFEALGVRAHPSLGWGPIHRGRYSGASLVLLADQESSDDLFTGRAMTGDAGQRFQQWLRAAGVTTKYAIVRVLPVDTSDLAAAKVRSLVDHAQVRRVYAAIIDALSAASPDLGAVVTVGPAAKRLAGNVNGTGAPVIAMKAWRESGALSDWNAALASLGALNFPRDVAPSGSYDGSRGEIPRADLPFGSLRWNGTSGDRAVRAKENGAPSPDYYKVYMPTWAAALTPAPLSASEAAAVPKIPHG
jgi:uracil-DNA glycosylase